MRDTYDAPPDSLQIADTGITYGADVTHIYLRQYVDGVEVVNGVANANIDRHGAIISSGNTMANTTVVSAYRHQHSRGLNRSSSISALDAINLLLIHTGADPLSAEELGMLNAAVAQSGDARNDTEYEVANLPKRAAVRKNAKLRQVLVHNEHNGLEPAWHIEMQQTSHWWSACVSKVTGKMLMLNDWYSHSEAFRVYPYTVNSPKEGSRTVVVNPADQKASPRGWVYTNTTMGNNVWAQYNPSGFDDVRMLTRTEQSAPGVFDYPIDLSKEPGTYSDASVTQLFYMVNLMHDLAYIYGFDEAAGNFQDTNFSGQGKGNDSVIAMAQDASSTDNSSFATPPDGQQPVMRISLWTETSPRRDADLEADLVAHEFTHGISARLTGGPSSSNCLNTREASGLSEGWSDAVAVILRTTGGQSRATDMMMGDYVTASGIRKYAYSTNTTTNPTMYSDLQEYQDPHDIGTVWATMLYEAMWNFIDALGLSSDIFKHDLESGNALFLQLLIDSFRLQPCNPTFLSSRDALVQAEKNRTQGKHACLIWRAFAKRGLGVGARSGKANDHTLPAGC
ncbi:hypothetical protein GQ54DRAFT_311628 [Martensiomyces pterosporus]|nr:hypothetical protein GQ54DRAFT_311628 [Martensiomyces pterosporus]